MKIYIQHNNGRHFFIPVPMCIASFACNISGFIIRLSEKYISEREREYINCIDFEKLGASLKYLKSYKGLKLIDIKTQEGYTVKIVI